MHHFDTRTALETEKNRLKPLGRISVLGPSARTKILGVELFAPLQVCGPQSYVFNGCLHVHQLSNRHTNRIGRSRSPHLPFVQTRAPRLYALQRTWLQTVNFGPTLASNIKKPPLIGGRMNIESKQVRGFGRGVACLRPRRRAVQGGPFDDRVEEAVDTARQLISVPWLVPRNGTWPAFGCSERWIRPFGAPCPPYSV